MGGWCIMPASYYVTIMLKKIILGVVAVLNISPVVSQVLYSEHFNTLTLNTGTYTSGGSTQTYLYSDVTNGLTSINNGNLAADTITGNYPYRVNGNKRKGWLAYKAANVADTFAVSTSWLNPIGSASAWLVTPTINNVTANTVLTWEAMAPDAINSDGYEIYVTTNTSTVPVVGDFTTLLYSTSAEGNTWQQHGISLASYNGQDIRIAFKNNSNNKYQLWLDDIEVKNITNSFDGGALSNDVYKYSTPNTNNIVEATFKNNGSVAATNITINYKIGNNPVVTETQNLATLLNYTDSRQLNFITPFISASAGYYPLKIWVSAINGVSDQDHTNDTVVGSITLSTAIPAKKVLVEQYTGAKYGWAPDSYEALKSIASTNTNVISASIHYNDQLSSATNSLLVTDYVTSFPTVTIDQFYFSANKKMAVDKINWNTYIQQRQSMLVPATVSVTNVTYNPTTKEINATVAADFVGDVKGDYRLNLYVKENNIYGDVNDATDNGWNQYSFSHNISSSPYYQLGSSLNATAYLLNANEFKHQYVVNDMLDGAYGAASIIPLNGTTGGQTYSKVYTYTLSMPAGNEFRYTADNIYLIGVLTEYNPNTQQRAVLNAAEVKLNTNPETTVGVNELSEHAIQLNVFPNPTSDVCYLNYILNQSQTVNVSVYNTLGELVYLETLNSKSGHVLHPLNLTHLQQGNYSVVVSFDQQSISKKLIIIK